MFPVDSLKNNILCYHGPINIDIISFMGNYLKQHIETAAVNLGRIYKVFIELTQNVSYYSARQHDSKRSFGTGIGWFAIEEEGNVFLVRTGNFILKEHGPILEKNSREINALNEEELRELKRKTRGQASMRDIGAHIGLIQTGLISGNALNLTIDPIDDKYSFFTVTARINKL